MLALRSRRPLRNLPLTMHHKHCWLDFRRPRQPEVLPMGHVIFRDESRLNLSADDHCTCVGRSVVWFSICCWMAYSYYIRCCSEGKDFLGHAISSSRLWSYYVGPQLRGQHFKDTCTAYAVKLPRYHLSSRQRSYRYRVILPMLCSRIRRTPIESQVTRPLASRESLWRDRKATAIVLEYK